MEAVRDGTADVTFVYIYVCLLPVRGYVVEKGKKSALDILPWEDIT